MSAKVLFLMNVGFAVINMLLALSHSDYMGMLGWACSGIGWLTAYNLLEDLEKVNGKE